ncbi:hypothetical protein AV274_6593 [Blastocystis sp. ATCC 50177/Nand II]|uniref:N-acetyltransferase domain-containing protein n=1 Tax=Blastocystis sp. subtype 1 (strain ATCC 50177 / NandII) TaxID=478820 RepID=A0A196S3M8_BLAHN|nr:hypothetical protein AV274_6593 [Blastocystis sp. ATCC 50177/Nand II]
MTDAVSKFDFSTCIDTPFKDNVDSIRIIPYESRFFQQVKQLYMASYRELAVKCSSIRKYVVSSIKRSFDVQSGVLKNEDKNRLWIAVNSDDDVVGMIGMRIIDDASFEVQKLVVARNYRRHSISNRLWACLEAKGMELCPLRPLRICLSTLSLLDVAESFYLKKGFALKRKDHFRGYDLDVFEKTVS